LVIKKYYYRWIYRRNGADRFIFLLPMDLLTKKNYRRKIHRQRIFVGDSVGKLITDGICVLHQWKNSIGKTVKSCSEPGPAWRVDPEAGPVQVCQKTGWWNDPAKPGWPGQDPMCFFCFFKYKIWNPSVYILYVPNKKIMFFQGGIKKIFGLNTSI
jgi:hypothetical protein